MADIYAGLTIMFGLSAAFFCLSLRVTSAPHRRMGDVAAVVTVLGMIVYIRYIWDNVLLSVVLPFSNLIILGNWLPLISGVLAGIAWNRTPGCVPRRLCPTVALLVAGGYSAIFPFLGQPPSCDDVWEDDTICMQTSPTTCAPACAATLLRAYGIDATEQEMAVLCLTRGGTTWKGLYRGLKRKTEQTPWDVEVFSGELDELRPDPACPIILTVGLDETISEEELAVYAAEFGLAPGVCHSVVLYKFTLDGNVAIADPAPEYGYDRWSVADLRAMWRNVGLRLVRR